MQSRGGRHDLFVGGCATCVPPSGQTSASPFVPEFRANGGLPPMDGLVSPMDLRDRLPPGTPWLGWIISPAQRHCPMLPAQCCRPNVTGPTICGTVSGTERHGSRFLRGKPPRGKGRPPEPLIAACAETPPRATRKHGGRLAPGSPPSRRDHPAQSRDTPAVARPGSDPEPPRPGQCRPRNREG
jgi:hypothetical protein